ncbi:hypothetical protein [Bordetella tumbae]|uniref:hypothetical protein n=1 Tax=Bordetella tumbae TaxID=1649139 RepID=UPI0039F0D7C1
MAIYLEKNVGVKIADFGSFETVPPLVTALIESDIAALDAALARGLNIEAEIELSEYTQEIPLVLALAVHASASVHWLVEHRANLNRADAPAFPIAARYANPDMMRYLVQHGADVHARKKVGGDAYQQALYGKKIAHLPVTQRDQQAIRIKAVQAAAGTGGFLAKRTTTHRLAGLRRRFRRVFWADGHGAD